MAAIVCHGLQSCHESPLVESRIHRLRLPSPKPKSKPLTSPQPIDLTFKSCFWEQNTKKPHCEENNFKTTDTVQNHNPNQGGWSFIQALSNVSKESSEKETTYVHPQVKQSSVRLSPKSLELCTENLGNETGTDIVIDSSIDLFSRDLGTKEQRESRQFLGAKKKTKPQKHFPPPLTTIRGAESLRVRPHREGGRLVIEVTKGPSSSSCFHAERSHGRLRLSFLDIPNPCFDTEEDENELFEEEFESEMNEQRQDMDEKEKEAEEEKKEEKTEEEAEAEVEGVENWNSVENEMMRREKYERGSRRRRNGNRGSRCKEDEHDNNDLLINWTESLWVSTS